MQSRNGVDSDAIHLRSSFESDTASHVYVKQAFNGIPVANAVANVAINKANKVATFGSSFVKASKVASPTPAISVEDAIATAEKQLDGTFEKDNFPEPALEYLSKDDGSVVLAHVFQVRNEEAGSWFEAFVDAHTGDLVAVTDFVSKGSVSLLFIEL